MWRSVLLQQYGKEEMTSLSWRKTTRADGSDGHHVHAAVKIVLVVQTMISDKS